MTMTMDHYLLPGLSLLNATMGHWKELNSHVVVLKNRCQNLLALQSLVEAGWDNNFVVCMYSDVSALQVTNSFSSVHQMAVFTIAAH